MSPSEIEAYRRGQIDMAEVMLGTIIIALTTAVIFGQAFIW